MFLVGSIVMGGPVAAECNLDLVDSVGTLQFAYGVTVVGDIAYVAYASGLQVIDLTDRTNDRWKSIPYKEDDSFEISMCTDL